MLYETLNQPKLLIIFIIVGFGCGLVYDIGNFIKFLFNNKKIANVILDIIETSVVLSVVFIVNLNFNYGQIRLFPILIFLIFFVIERYTIGKIIAKIYISCYNLLTKLNKKIWSKLKHDKTNKTD